MPDRPILFSAPMVRALLAGTKTQTRRKISPTQKDLAPGQILCFEGPRFGGTAYRFSLPYERGDRLYVREDYYQHGHWWEDPNDLTKGGKPKWKFIPFDHEISFEAPKASLKSRSRANPADIFWYKRLGRFMPRRYSRLTLTVTDVRIERLQDISEADAVAEGIEDVTRAVAARDPSLRFWKRYRDGGWNGYVDTAIGSYASLWTEINGAGAWEANPWVVAVSFDVREGNIDV
ncbi:MAG: hypothetical protein ACT6Q7_02655 [Blastomonas fulva]|uniref:hypothetical protein n=1 Tax=Blastomonas fulva TaxID=1550728 RepID=UPI004033B386